MRILAALCFSAVAFSAEATPIVQWSKVPTNGADERACIAFAAKVAREKLQNVRDNPAEVVGNTDKARVTMICIGRGTQKALGLVMVVGDDANVAEIRQLRDDLARAWNAAN